MAVMEKFFDVRTGLNHICEGELFAGMGEVTIMLEPEAYEHALKYCEKRAQEIGTKIDPKVYDRGWFTVFGIIYKKKKRRK